MDHSQEIAAAGQQRDHARLASFLGFAVLCIFLGALTAAHVAWRDELQAWLIARESPSLLKLFNNIRWENHPAVWFLLLWLVQRATTNLHALAWLHYLIVCGGLALLWFKGPFSWPERILLVLGYYLVFEYALIARPYSLQLPCMFGYAIVRRTRPLLAASLLAILANTTVFGFFAAAGLVVDQLILLVQSQARERGWRASAILLVAGGMLLAWVTVRRGADARPEFVPHGLIQVARAWSMAFLPLPIWKQHFWNTLAVDGLPQAAMLALVFVSAVLVAIALAPSRRWSLTFLATAAIALVFNVVSFAGFARHNGTLFIALLTAVWIGRSEAIEDPSTPERNPSMQMGNLSLQRLARPAFLVLLILQVAGGVIALRFAMTTPFSASRAAARFLEQNGLAHDLVGDADFLTEPVGAWLDQPIFYLHTNRFGRYIRWRNPPQTQEVLFTRLRALLVAQHEMTLVLSYELPSRFRWPDVEAKLIADFDDSIVADETYFIYRLKLRG